MGQTVTLLIGESRKQISINSVTCKNVDMIGSTLKGTQKWKSFVEGWSGRFAFVISFSM